MSPNLSIKSKHSVGKRIAVNTGMMVFAKLLAVSCGILTFVIAADALGARLFGTVVFIHAYMLFFGEVTTFRSWQSIIKFGAEDLKNNDVDGLTKLINFGYRLDIVAVFAAYLLAVGLMGFVVWLAQQFPEIIGADVETIQTLQKYSMLYCLLIFAKIVSTSIGVLRLFDRFLILALLAVIMPVIRLAGSLFVVSQGGGLEQFLMVWFVASFAVYMATFVTGLVELKSRRLLWPTVKAKAGFFKQRKGLWPFVIKSNIDATLATGNMHLPVILVTMLFGTAWTGVYKIADEIAKLLTEAFKLLDQVIYPELAKLVTNGEADKIWRLTIRAALILLSVGLLFAVLISNFAQPLLLKIFGEEFILAAPLASLLVLAAALMGVAAPLYPIFYAAQRPERAIYIRGGALIIYIASFFVLSATIGKMAPGWAALAGNLCAVVFLLLIAKKTLKAVVKRQTPAVIAAQETK